MERAIGLLLVASLAAVALGQTGGAAAAPKLLWGSRRMVGESLLFVRPDGNGAATCRLLFTPSQILEVRGSAGNVTYQAGRDYQWQAGSPLITLPAGSTIPVTTRAKLTPPLGTQPYGLKRRDGKGDLFFAPGLEYAAMQVVVTYDHAGTAWTVPAPGFAERELPTVLGKLTRGEPVAVTFYGDSITEGGNASQPSLRYPDLVTAALKQAYRCEITHRNRSVGGMNSVFAVQHVGEVAADRPDLVVLAWGMNDSSGIPAGRPAKDYLADTKTQMAEIRKVKPEAEFILVASMLPNADCCWANPQALLEYRDGLKTLAGPGVAVADVTTVWEQLLKTKDYLDFTGNGVNHPNDWGHRLYAEVVASLLIRP